MRFLIWSLLGVAGLGVLVACIGWILPVAHEASATARFERAPAEVYGVIADVANYASWFDEVSRVEMLDAPNGRIRFREHMSTGPVVMEVEHAAPPARFVTRIADPDQPFGGTWTFDIAPDNGGSRLTITERGEIYNPIFRFMARFVFGYTATMDGCLRSLRQKFGETGDLGRSGD